MILFAAIVLGVIIFQKASLPIVSPFNNTSSKTSETSTEPRVVSTNPTNLDYAVILPTQTVEITFNLPIENEGEFKNSLEPKADYQIKLSDDRKTAKIIPLKPFTLGTDFTLFIKPDTKFDGKKTLGHDLYYHFKTIEYKGV